jgi:hypothetical protein
MGPWVVLRYFDGCPNWRVAEERLRQMLAKVGRAGVPVELERVETPERAQAVAFRGSPTVLVNGVDPFLDEDAPVGLACRIYLTEEGPQGVPSLALTLTQPVYVFTPGQNGETPLYDRGLRHGPCRIRTYDLGIKSPLLYQLS